MGGFGVVGQCLCWYTPFIHSFLPQFGGTYYVPDTRLVLEKTEVNKMFSLPSNNLHALVKKRVHSLIGSAIDAHRLAHT